MSSIHASVGILTFNSGATLRRALESVKDFDDIVVCDGGSSDDTLAIAAEFGARVITQDPQFKNADNTLRDYGGVRNQLLEAARHDWFLYIDSDETISDGLREDIQKAVAEPDGALVYRVPIGIMMDGRYIKYSSNYPGYQTRFFNKRSGARFVRLVHERIEFGNTTKVGTFVHPWYVHTTYEFWQTYWRTRTSKYRTEEIKEAGAQPFLSYLRYTVFWHIRTALSVFVKALFIQLVHGSKNAVPFIGEMGRAYVPLVHAWRTTVYRLRR